MNIIESIKNVFKEKGFFVSFSFNDQQLSDWWKKNKPKKEDPAEKALYQKHLEEMKKEYEDVGKI